MTTFLRLTLVAFFSLLALPGFNNAGANAMQGTQDQTLIMDRSGAIIYTEISAAPEDIVEVYATVWDSVQSTRQGAWGTRIAQASLLNRYVIFRTNLEKLI